MTGSTVQNTLQYVDNAITQVIESLHNPNPLQVELILGELRYRLIIVHRDANEVIQDLLLGLANKLKGLQFRTPSALGLVGTKLLYSDQRSEWVLHLQQLQKQARVVYKQVVALLTQQKEALREEQARSRIQQQTPGSLAAQLVQVRSQITTEIEAPESSPLPVPTRQANFWERDLDRIQGMTSLQISKSLLDPKQGCGVAMVSCVFIGFQYDAPLIPILRGMGITLDRLMGASYTIMHNARVFGVLSEAIPGNRKMAFELVEALLSRSAEGNPQVYGGLSLYPGLSPVLPKGKQATHRYYLCIPTEAMTHLKFVGKWDIWNTPQLGKKHA